MQEIFLDALFDSLRMIPFLFAAYIFIELIEYKFGDKIRKNAQRAGKAGPAIGAIAGTLPQCGFSVVITALYTQKLVTIGTLLAVYLSTSDEAIPIILANPDKVGLIFPLLLSKVIIGITAGYSLDFIYRRRNREVLKHISDYKEDKDDKSHYESHESVKDEQACCGHSACSASKKFDLRELFLHPLIHTLKIFVYVLIISFLIGLAIFYIGNDNLTAFLSGNAFWQPFLAALVGLIPNCAASVAITQLYIDGIISYSSVIAGLCASGGLGLLLLFKEDKSRKDAYRILVLLYSISVLAGLIFQYVLNK